MEQIKTVLTLLSRVDMIAVFTQDSENKVLVWYRCMAPEVHHPCESLPLAESHALSAFLDGTDRPPLSANSIHGFSYSRPRLFSLAQRCQFLMTALASRNFLAHLPQNTVQLYCLCVEKFAFWLVIYIKTFNTVKHQQLNETQS